jgi:hypothetical protein
MSHDGLLPLVSTYLGRSIVGSMRRSAIAFQKLDRKGHPEDFL